MKINSVTPTPASRVGDGGYETFVASHRPPVAEMSDEALASERSTLFGYTEADKLARSREVCDEIHRRALYANTPTSVLLEMNRTYTREYRANRTAAGWRAVEQTSLELSRRGA